MFFCAITGKLSKSGESPHKILLARRERTYTRWVRNEETNKWEEIFASSGWEIVKEIDATAAGETEWLAWSEDERWLFIKNYYPYLVKQVEDSKDAARTDVVQV